MQIQNNMKDAHSANTRENQKTWRFAMILFALLPFFGLYMPRALFFLPGLFALIILGIQKFVLKNPIRITIKPAYIIIGAVCGLALLSSLWALNTDISLKRAIKVALILPLAALLIQIALNIPKKALQRYGWLPAASVFAAFGLLSLEYLANFPVYRVLNHIPSAETPHLHVYNRSASVLVALLPAAILALLAFRKKETSTAKTALIALACLAAFAPAFAITASQSAQLSGLCAALIFLAFPYRQKWAWPLLSCGIAALILAAPFLSIWLFRHYAHDIQDLPKMGNGDQSASAGARVEIWDYVSRYLLQNPLYGFGMDATRAVKHFDSHQIFQEGTTMLHPHNFALQFWIEYGVIGAAMISAVIASIIRMIGKMQNILAQRFMLATLVAMISIASTGYGFWQSWWVGLMPMAAAFVILAARIYNTANDNAGDV